VTRALLRGDLDDARARCESSSSPAADVFLAALAAAARRSPARANGAADPDLARIAAAVERERQQVNLRLRRSLWLLGTIGATAPFIGLFGTVWGIMHAFRQMGITGQGGFAVVATGISEALITTAAGIAVAILAVILYNLLNVHVQKLALQLRLLVEEYLEVVAETLPAIRPAAKQAAEALREG
jgi:biopolymer transport protein ExbB